MTLKILLEIITFLGVGAFSGFLAGLLGIGGGLVMVPFLAYLLPYLHFPLTLVMQVAVTTSLANVALTAVVSVYRHHHYGNIRWFTWREVIMGSILGAILGSLLAKIISSHVLALVFGVFIFFTAYRLFKANNTMSLSTKKINFFVLNLLSFVAALISALLGMGGGSLMVPLYHYYRLPLKEAIATSSATGLVIGSVGLLSALLFQWNVTSPKPWMTHYLYWPAFLCMSTASLLTAPLGVRATQVLSPVLLRKIFAIFLVVVGVVMIGKFFS